MAEKPKGDGDIAQTSGTHDAEGTVETTAVGPFIGKRTRTGKGVGGKAMGRRIRDRRVKFKIKANALAEEAEITPAGLQKYEDGNVDSPRFATFMQLADALGVNARCLYYGHRHPVARDLTKIVDEDAVGEVERKGDGT